MLKQKNKILVIDANGVTHESIVGDEIASMAIENNWQGIVLNGFIRDADEINKLNIKILAKGEVFKKTKKNNIGRRDILISFGGLIFKPSNPITIYAENTPNPSVIKFVANKRLVNTSHEFKSIESAQNCSIAKALFNHDFISELYIDFNFISITIKKENSWDNHIMEIREFILSYIRDGNEIIDSKFDIENDKNESIDFENMDEISKEIAKLIDDQIKPAVASDGGNILFQSYDSNSKEVKVILQGACSGCPSSTFTLKNGIESMLKDYLPGKISNVIAING